MSHKQPATSLSDIHSIYQGKRRPASSASTPPTYTRAPFSPRDEGHSGSAPERQPAKPKGKR